MGGNVFVLPGITIGHNATIGARSVVTKNVNPDTIVVGQPAKGIAKTSERTRNLTPEEKNIIVKDILIDFMHVYQENIIPVKSWDNLEMIFLFQNRTILFLPRADLFSVIDEKMKKYKKPGILISFGIPENIKTNVKKIRYTGLIWSHEQNHQQQIKMVGFLNVILGIMVSVYLKLIETFPVIRTYRCDQSLTSNREL